MNWNDPDTVADYAYAAVMVGFLVVGLVLWFKQRKEGP